MARSVKDSVMDPTQETQHPVLITLTDVQFRNLLTRESSSNAPRVCRPTVSLDASDEDWRLFLFQWERYKAAAALTKDETVRHELLSACSPDLERQLFHLRGTTLNVLSESDLLAQIKAVAVRGLHTAVHRSQFHALRQAQGEDITHFVSRLRSKAALCDFSVIAHRPHAASTEPGPISYEEDVLQTQMVVGLYNPEHQSQILSPADRYPTFAQKFQALLAMQAAEDSEKQLQTEASATGRQAVPDIAAAHRSAYQQQQRHKSVHPPSTDSQVELSPCGWCGGRHKTSGTRYQHSSCPARGKFCIKCQKGNHFARACRAKQSATVSAESSLDAFGDGADELSAHAQVSEPAQSTSALPASTIARSTVSQSSAQSVPHMEWDKGQFTPSSPKRHPELPVTLTIMQQAHSKFGKRLTGFERSNICHGARATACADTGAMTCSGGIEILKLLRCPEHLLLKTSHRIIGVTGTLLEVIGSLLLRIESKGRITRQVVYISRNTRGLYLSERALKDLGAVPEHFPSPSNESDRSRIASQSAGRSPGRANGTAAAHTAPCGCPKRSTVPPIPERIPYPADEDNRQKLEHWIRDHFASSAFNTCEHQPLQEMTGAPLDIQFKTDVTPSAVHTPIPVPHHWKRQVKAGLDQDVRLGIIEPVPQGTPTRWCSRMVVAAKKDGSPRRTVDLQRVNDATLRETHHTPSPFNLFASVPPGTKKTVLDAWNGYHSLPLAEKARDATTFITEWGRYRYRRAPQGFHTSGDGYTRRMDDITAGTERLKRCVDDSLLWDSSLEESFWHTVRYITLCGEHGVVFNPSKFAFGADTVDFAGFTVTADGYKPTG